MAKLSVSHLLGIKHLNLEDINLIFNTADHFKEVINRPIVKKYLPYEILPLPIFFLKTVPEPSCPLNLQKKGFQPM